MGSLKDLICKRGWTSGVLVSILVIGTTAVAFQYGRRNRSSDDRGGVPIWELNQDYKTDVFTFVRVRYSDDDQRGWGGGGWRGKWATDYPDSDHNFSLRLQQLTSMKVNPFPLIVELTEPRIFDYPFLYLIEPGLMSLSGQEVENLRHYCLNGGFLMVDDFWGQYEYDNFYAQIKKVFPDREPKEVPLDHEIFQCVYPLKEKPQVPSANAFYAGYSYEPRRECDTRGARYLAIENDANRIMVFICHNTDLGDGWEREGENKEYFAEYSVKKSYPMGINIVTYAMTH